MSFEYKPPYAPSEIGADTFRDYLAKLREMQNWCAEQKMDHWSYHKGIFMFEREEDYMMFMLRWL